MSTSERASFEQLQSYTFPGLLDRWGIASLRLLGRGVYGSCYASECGVIKHIALPPVQSPSGRFFSPSVRHRLLLYELEILEFITSTLRDGRHGDLRRNGEELLASASSSSLCDDFENVTESVGQNVNDLPSLPDELLCDKWNLMGLRAIIPPKDIAMFRKYGVYFIMERRYPCSLRQHIRQRRAADLELLSAARFVRVVPSRSVQRLNTPELLNSDISPTRGCDARGVGSMGENEARIVLWELLRGLRALHVLGLCHLDIKPSNILIDSKRIKHSLKRGTSTRGSVCLTDFGLSMPVQCPLSRAYSRVVSSWYRPPEICKRIAMDVPGRRSRGPVYDGKADIWSTGCILAELLTGKALFRRQKNLDVYRAQNAFLRFPKSHLQDVAHVNGVAHFSRNALDLLCGMLKRNPEERLSASEAMAHPFFDAIRERTSSPVLPSSSEVCPSELQLLVVDDCELLPTTTKFQDVHPECTKSLPSRPQWTQSTVMNLRTKIFDFVKDTNTSCCVVG